MFLGGNCADKHFVETKNNLLRFLEHLLFFVCLFVCCCFFVFFCFFFVVVVVFIKATVQEFEQNQCHDIIRSSEMNVLFSK